MLVRLVVAMSPKCLGKFPSYFAYGFLIWSTSCDTKDFMSSESELRICLDSDSSTTIFPLTESRNLAASFTSTLVSLYHESAPAMYLIAMPFPIPCPLMSTGTMSILLSSN